jgi:hypothetical protein
MGLIRDISTFVWILLFYVFARYAAVDLDMPSLNMNYILWAQNDQFFITTKDAFIIAGIFLLFIEIYKAATYGEYSATETVVSFLTSIAYLVVFLLWDRAHTVEFFILMLMSFLDAIGGFIISINAARKDISIK